MLAAAAVRKKNNNVVARESIQKPQVRRRESFCPRTIPYYKHKVDWRIPLVFA